MTEWRRRPSREEISPAKLKWYSKCPYAFRLKYVEKIDPIYPDPEVFVVGAAVHDTIHEYYLIYPPAEKARELLLTTLYRKWDYGLPYGKFGSAIESLENFSDFEELRRAKNDVKPMSELECSNKGYFGIIDFYLEQQKCIMDFKTGRKKERKSYEYQTYVYSLLKEGEGKVFFYYLQPNEIVCAEATKEIAEEVEGLKRQILISIKEREYPPIGRCNSCEYKHCCSMKH